MESCFFCTIIQKKDPAFVVYEDNLVVAFLDKHPSSPGHTLVIPKTHAATILDLDAYELGHLWSFIQTVVSVLERTFDTNMLSIGINHGELAGIPHLHVHLIPRHPKDGGQIIQSLVYNKGAEDLDLVAKKIKKNI